MSEYLDASIIVKWFRSDEPGHEKAMVILERIQSMDAHYVTSSLTLLEVTRAMVKAGYSKDRIRLAFELLKDLFEIGAIEKVKLDTVLNTAMELEIDLTLYASDAVHLASAIYSGCSVIWSEDEHHTKQKTRLHLKRYDMEVKTLEDFC